MPAQTSSELKAHNLVSLFRRMAFALAAVAGGIGAAQASPEKVRAALEGLNLPALRTAAETDAERKLTAAVELSWTLRDAEAAPALISAAGGQSDLQLRGAALWELMAVQARGGAFMSAVSAGEAASQLDPPSASLTQALEFFRALAVVPATRAVNDPSGRVSIKRDLAGLMRTDIVVGGVTAGAIIDTGANFSTVTETLAQRMGLRMLDADVSVGSSSYEAVASKLGVAERLKVGDAEFANVVFIVLPDKDLSFADGAYTIDAILGMPVFFQMKRIAVTNTDGAEWFEFGDKAPTLPDEGRNLLFNGQSPMIGAAVMAEGVRDTVLLLLDSGAQTSNLERRFADRNADMLGSADTITTRRGGAGGTVTSDNTLRLAKVELVAGGRTVSLADVNVEDTYDAGADGKLGLDVLGGGFAIDWERGVLIVN